jgi:WD40 repeat protein
VDTILSCSNKMYRLEKQLITGFSLSANASSALAPSGLQTLHGAEEDDIPDANEYITEIDISADKASFAATASSATSEHSIIIGACDPGFEISNRLTFHTDSITALQFSSSPNILFSSSMDRRFCIWDIRSAESPVNTLLLDQDITSSSVGLGDNLAALACGASIIFYDVRALSNGPLGEYADCHTDDITQVKFNPEAPTILGTAGEDGLICVFNTSVPAKEEAVLSILNTDSPLRRVGFFGPNLEGIYALSNIETASFWHYPSAQRLGYFSSIREQISIDYLIDCYYSVDFSLDSDADSVSSLYLLGGSFTGSIVGSKVDPNSVTPLFNMSNGHMASVRCVKEYNDTIILTGGEDARICVWKRLVSGEEASSDSNLRKGYITSKDHISDSLSPENSRANHGSGASSKLKFTPY